MTLFANHGYDAVGVQQICQEAGVTKPTLYHYFKSKHGLFEALILSKSIPLITDLTKVCQYHGDVVENVSKITHFYFDYARREPNFYRLMLLHLFMPNTSEVFAVISNLQQQQFSLVAALFKAASEDHGNMRGRHRQYAVSLRGMIDTYVGVSLRGYVLPHDDEIVHRITHQFLHGIFS